MIGSNRTRRKKQDAIMVVDSDELSNIFAH